MSVVGHRRGASSAIVGCALAAALKAATIESAAALGFMGAVGERRLPNPTWLWRLNRYDGSPPRGRWESSLPFT
jgi:hypothetical protein